MKIHLVLSVAGALALGGCAVPSDSGPADQFGPYRPGGPVYQPQEIVADRPMPTEPPFGTYYEGEEKAPPASFSDPYWIRGYWAWKNNDWEWIKGRWVQRPKPGMIWINARSYSTGPRVFWQTGYWQ